MHRRRTEKSRWQIIRCKLRGFIFAAKSADARAISSDRERPPLRIAPAICWALLALGIEYWVHRTAGRWSSSSLGDALILYGTQAFVVTVACFAARSVGWSAKDYLALRRPTVFEVLLGITAQATLTLAVYLAGEFGQMFASRYAGPTFQDSTYLMNVVAFLLGNVLVGPLGEEILFRGFLYRSFAASIMGPTGAIALTATAFALSHLDTMHVWHLMSGALFGALRWYTGSLTAPMTAHIFGNALAAFLRLSA